MKAEKMTCPRCDSQGINCWVLMGTTTCGAFYNHAHLAFVEVCPFCEGKSLPAPPQED